MKNTFGISTLAITLAIGAFVCDANAAATVRALGGSGTYSSASSASSGSSATTRGSSVSVAPVASSGSSGVAATGGGTTTGRVSTMPRLSLGSYLTGAINSSGGMLRPVVSGDDSSSSGSGSGSTGGNMTPGASAEIIKEIDRLHSDVESLRASDESLLESMDAKQDVLVPTEDGYVVIDNNEIFLDVENLSNALEELVDDGREVEIDYNGEYVVWRYVGDTVWNNLISKEDITGPQGPEGPQGPQGEAANLDAYSTTEQMNFAIANAIGALAEIYATKTELTKYPTSDTVAATYATKAELAKYPTADTVVATYATKEELKNYPTSETVSATYATKTELATKATTEALERGLAAKADAAALDNYVKTGTLTQYYYDKAGVDNRISEIVSGDLSTALTQYVKTEDMNTALAGKVDNEDMVNYATVATVDTKADKTAVESLALTVADVDTVATSAAQGVDTVSDLVDEVIGHVKRNKTAIGNMQTVVGAGELSTEARTIVGAINEITGRVDDLPTQSNFQEVNQAITNIENALETKVETTELNEIAFTGQITNENVAENAGISRIKLSSDVQDSLDRADEAVVVDGVGSNRILGTDDAGQETWYEIVM